MKLSALLFFCLLSAAAAFCEPISVTVAYPREGAKLSAVKNSFLFGSVSPSSAVLTVNGATVPVYRTGSYLAMIPFSPGEFKITARATSGDQSTETVRAIFVASPTVPMPPDTLAVSDEGLLPALDMTVTDNDIVPVRVKATPGCTAECRVKYLKGPTEEWQYMTERNPGQGTYESQIVVGPETRRGTFEVEFRVTDPREKHKKTAAPGKVKVQNKSALTLLEVVSDEAVVRAGPSIGSEQMGYDLFWPKGVKLISDGRIGNEYRLRFSPTETGWSDEKNFKLLPAYVPFPKIVIDNVKIQHKKQSAFITVETKERVPYRVRESEDMKSLVLTLYYAVSNVDRVRYDTSVPHPLVQELRWAQSGADTVELHAHLKEKIWGYDVRYDGSRLVLEILSNPSVRNSGSSLNGWTIAIDPGHSPQIGDGAISPQNVTEGEVNYKTASCLKEKLEKLGAKVFMTRSFDENAPLPERVRRAWTARADLFVSVHANAVPDGTDPWERSGFSVYYFQPHSMEFARLAHKSFAENLKLPDDGLHYGNLAVCRATQMPAILTETAYLIRPDEEELLLSRDFQCKAAESIAESIQSLARGQ